MPFLISFLFFWNYSCSAFDNLARIKTYEAVSKHLKSLSEEQLSQILKTAKPLYSNYATTFKTVIGQTTVFIKKIPLTDLENTLENHHSTVNLFELPTYYQYGVGSAGFSAWRELQAHITTTDWVISGECLHFPIMYHWRLLPNRPFSPITEEKYKKFDKTVAYWGNSQAVRTRLEALQQSSASIVLFLEYIPETAYVWLAQQLSFGNKLALAMIEKDLLTVISFMNAKGMLHFDAHFKNILTDGHRLYFTDFGLVLSSEFSLSRVELDFLNKHRNYDYCSAIMNFIHCIVTILHGKKNWDKKLEQYATGKITSSVAQTIINRYILIAIVMDKFYKGLIKDKSTPYPANELDWLLRNLDIKAILGNTSVKLD